MVDISKAFGTSSKPLVGFFQEPGLAFYIPLYQRDYSWDKENIEQLMEDICQGVENLLNNDQEIRFLGTIIRVTERDRHNINPRDDRAIPTRVDKIIDGQQRISTIALLGALMYAKLKEIDKRLPDNEPYGLIKREIIQSRMEMLVDIFSFDLTRGNPRRKPVIIRGAVDSWTLDGHNSDHYKSPIASYIASVITSIENKKKSTFPSIPRGTRIGDNLALMKQYLDDIGAVGASRGKNVDFPNAQEILNKIEESYIWDYPRQEACAVVMNESDTSNERKYLISLVQLLAFTHFFLHRCCFTVIDPVSDDWAFDMFQSLNATGTPLTAIETFKPLVVNVAEHHSGFKGSAFEGYFSTIDELFKKEKTAAQKTKLTNDYLTTLSHIFEGNKLARQFSSQRKWLEKRFNDLTSLSAKEAFVQRMADVATYLADLRDFNPDDKMALPALEDSEMERNDKELATLCTLYLNDANHAMAHTILSRFYAYLLRQYEGSAKEFVEACKSIVAFYTLWRTAYSNSGLDDAYRRILRGNKDKNIEPMAWLGDYSLFTSSRLKELLRDELVEKNIGTKDEWLKRAIQFFHYDFSGQHLCRFSLLIIANDTVPDNEYAGLVLKGRNSITNYLTPEIWNKRDFSTVEHIAPQRPPTDSIWDKSFYEEDRFQSIGNLTLLPDSINKSAGNKSWKAKYIYYMHLSEKNPVELERLQHLAVEHGVELAEQTINLLCNATTSYHLESIINVGLHSDWNADLVDMRTKRICQILWDRLAEWLEITQTNFQVSN